MKTTNVNLRKAKNYFFNKKSFELKNLFYLFSLLILISLSACNKNSLQTDAKKDSVINSRNQEIKINCLEIEDTAKMVGFATGEFVDELFKNGIEFVYNGVEQLKSITEPITFEEQIDTLSIIFNIPRSITSNYFNTVCSCKSYVLDSRNRDRIIEGIYCYAVDSTEGNNSISGEELQLELRFVFGVLARALGSPDCGFWNLFGSCVDAAISTAAACAAPNPLSIGGAIGSVAAYAEQLSNCL